jgi:phosphoribosyl 1,2-cyclic phosphate phosphodiesterase
LKLTFLGTGTSQGVPVIACECEVCNSVDYRNQRLRSSVHFDDGETSIVVDTGPDFRQQMLSNRILKLDAILYTHEHKDHTAGMDDVRSYNFKQKKDMPLYGRQFVLDQIQQEFAYVFSKNKYPGTPSVALHSIENNTFQVGTMEVTPIEVLHYKLPVYGFRVKDIAYITDAKTISAEEKSKLQGLDVLVLNALQNEPHISHFTLSEALALIEEIQPKRAFLTHISHKLGLHKEVQETLPENVKIAYDGLSINS